MIVRPDGLPRCDWKVDWDADPELLHYHDDEWGTPRRGRRDVFEALSLGIFQAGLGWLTVFHKRQAFREAFHDFEPAAVASMDQDEIEALLSNPAIIRNRRKIAATVHNAVVATTSDTDLADLMWRFVPEPHAQPDSRNPVPVMSPESDALAAALKSHGYKFVGSTSVYAFMQSLGIVNDHVRGCFRSPESTT